MTQPAIPTPLDAETVDTHCYLVGDEDCGVGIYCRTCRGLLIAYYSGILLAGDPYPDVPTATGIFQIYPVALKHVHEYHQKELSP